MKKEQIDEQTNSERARALADELFASLTPEEAQESELSLPANQRRIITSSLDLSVSTLVDYVRSGQIQVPDFQRHYVWDDGRASRLIESLLIQCPIPVVYLNRTADEKLDVIDGNQRLTTLRRFMDNGFALKELTAFPELKGMVFGDLDERLKRNIQNRTLRCVVIERETHAQVKFDVFQRLNSGAVPLSPQELRHGMFFGPLMVMLDALVKNRDFALLVGMPRNKRMKRQELALRFLAFSADYENYRKPMSSFLNDYAEKHGEISAATRTELRDVFAATFRYLLKSLGENAFRPALLEKRPAFNAAVFDALSAAVGRRVAKGGRLPSGGVFKKAYARLQRSEGFLEWVTRATSDELSVKRRIAAVESLLA